MSTPEQQIDFLLTPDYKGGAGQGCVEQSSLDELEQFHGMLCEHSGVSVLEEGEGEGEDEEGLQARLKQLYDVIVNQQQVQKDDTEVVREEEVKGELCMCVLCEEWLSSPASGSSRGAAVPSVCDRLDDDLGHDQDG